MDNFLLKDDCDSILMLESNYGRDFNESIEHYNESKENRTILLRIYGIYSENQEHLFGLNVADARKLASYLNELADMYER